MEFSKIYVEYLKSLATGFYENKLTFAIIGDYSDPNFYTKLRFSLYSILVYNSLSKIADNVKTRTTQKVQKVRFIPIIKNIDDYNRYYKILLIIKGLDINDNTFKSFIGSATYSGRANFDVIPINNDLPMTVTQLQQVAVEQCHTKFIQFMSIGDMINLDLFHEIYFVNKINPETLLTGPICITPNRFQHLVNSNGYVSVSQLNKRYDENGYLDIDQVHKYSVEEAETLKLICRSIGRLGVAKLRSRHRYGIRTVNNLRIFGYIDTIFNEINTFIFSLPDISINKFIASYPVERYTPDTVEYCKCYSCINKTIWNTQLLKFVYNEISERDLHVNSSSDLLVDYIARKILIDHGLEATLYYAPYYYSGRIDTVNNEDDINKVNEFIDGKSKSKLDSVSIDDLDLDAII